MMVYHLIEHLLTLNQHANIVLIKTAGITPERIPLEKRDITIDLVGGNHKEVYLSIREPIKKGK